MMWSSKKKEKEEPSKQGDETENSEHEDGKSYGKKMKDIETCELEKEQHDTEHISPTSVAKLPHTSFNHKLTVEQVSEGDDNSRLSDQQNVITYSQLGNSAILPEFLFELDVVEQRKQKEKTEPS